MERHLRIFAPRLSPMRWACLCILWLWLWLWVPAPAQPIRPCVGKLRSHVATEGENLFTIAKKYRLAVDHLAFANGFPVTTTRVKAGTRLLIPTWRVLPDHPPATGLVINLPERGLYLFRGGHFDRFFPISIGDEDIKEGHNFSTPSGKFRVIEKQKNPTWYPPPWAKEKKPVGPGPDNPLGDRWIGLSLPRTGIHGTNDPYNIGNSVTHGCIRTYPDLLHELYDIVSVGWPVTIEYETAKLGRTPNGELVFVTFPDVYKRSPTVPALEKILREQGLRSSVKRKNLNSIAELCLGFPVSVGSIQTVNEETNRRLPED